MKDSAVDILKLIAVGVLIVIGMRIAEWVIPKPEIRVIVCMADNLGKVETCTTAADLLKAHNAPD